MDGLVDEDHSDEFAGLSHQLTVLPDETVAFYAYGTNGCDDIKLRAPDGTVTTVVNAQTAHGGTNACHVNAIFYSRLDDTLIFGDLDNNCLTKITRTGATVWVLNGGVDTGPASSFNGGGLVWQGGEHGFHILGLDDFVIFNNNAMMPAGSKVSWGSAAGDGERLVRAIEVKLDLTAMTATQIWSYQALGVNDNVLGDAQRLPNGNTIVDFSTKGTIQEVDAQGNASAGDQDGNQFRLPAEARHAVWSPTEVAPDLGGAVPELDARPLGSAGGRVFLERWKRRGAIAPRQLCPFGTKKLTFSEPVSAQTVTALYNQ